MARGSRWVFLVLATCSGVALLLSSCRFTPGKAVTFKSTVETQFDIPPDKDFVVGSYRFGEAFELGPGMVGAKFSTRVPQAQVGSVPQSLTWTMVWYDPTLTTIRNSYQITAPLKMRPHGRSAYDISYTYKPSAFAGFNLEQNDYLQMNLKPTGGTIGTGWKVGVAYSYKLNF